MSLVATVDKILTLEKHVEYKHVSSLGFSHWSSGSSSRRALWGQSSWR